MSDFEYRLGWTASSNVSFRGTTDWEPWGGFEETAEDVEKVLCESGGTLPQGLEEVLNASGFEWWPEIREVAE